MANASYAARQPPAVEGEEPVHVLVTGFGPFLDKYPKNSSWEIASTLPALIPASSSNRTPIHIRIHHEPIRVAYRNILTTVPKLLPQANFTSPPPDIILHIGLAASRSFYAIEDGAHAKGYGKTADVDGELFSDSQGDDVFPCSQYPAVLHTGFSTADVLARWKTHFSSSSPSSSSSSSSSRDTTGSQQADIRTNPDAGNFLCGFIYYNSLARFYQVNGGSGDRPVVFLHVPDLTGSEEKMKEGWEVAVALIKALVESRRVVGTRNFGSEEGAVQEDDRRNNTAV